MIRLVGFADEVSMSHRFRKCVPFNRQPRRRQKESYIRLKNKIRRAEPILGGAFFTHDYLHGENGWADVYFLGHKAPVFYNAALHTTRSAYKDKVWDIAWDRSYSLAPDVGPGLLEQMVKDPKTGNYFVPEHEPVRYPALDNLSRIDWVRRQLPVIADERAIQVFEEWSLHYDYEYGIGLHATLDVPFLTIDAISHFIERFLASESAYRAPQPCGYSHADITCWGLESNAIIDPWEWRQVTAEEEKP